MADNNLSNGIVNAPYEPMAYLPEVEIGEYFLQEMRNREKWILDMGGQPVKLLKRRWFGTKCPDCWDEARKQSENDCPTCFGTGFISGYYDPIDIKISLVNPAVKLVSMMDHGMKREISPKSWTLWEPQLSNKDVLVTQQNLRLWVENVTATTWRGLPIHQNMDCNVIEHSNIIYKIPVTL